MGDDGPDVPALVSYIVVDWVGDVPAVVVSLCDASPVEPDDEELDGWLVTSVELPVLSVVPKQSYVLNE